MNGELEFRVWGKNHSTMEYISNLYWFEEQGVLDSKGRGHFVDYDIMQYTGLKDEDGVKIFEGDIVIINIEGDEIRSNVFWADGGFCITAESGYEPYLGEYHGPYGTVVVGNVYENPELMETL